MSTISRKPIIVVIGQSGAGKDTSYTILEQQLCLPAQNVKFVKPFKEAMANYLGVALEMLEDRVYRNQILPELGCSPLDLMVRGFKHMPNIHPELGIYYTRRQVQSVFENDQIPIFTDCRNPAEIGFISQLTQEGHKLYTVHLVRSDLDLIESDLHLPSNSRQLRLLSSHYLMTPNNGTKEDLAESLTQLSGAVNWHIRCSRYGSSVAS